MQRNNSIAITSEGQLWRKVEKLFDGFCKSRFKDLTVSAAAWHHQRSLLMPDAGPSNMLTRCRMQSSYPSKQADNHPAAWVLRCAIITHSVIVSQQAS